MLKARFVPTWKMRLFGTISANIRCKFGLTCTSLDRMNSVLTNLVHELHTSSGFVTVRSPRLAVGAPN